MTTYSKHNNYALLDAGATVWGTTIGANFSNAERGITIKGTAGTTISEYDAVYLDSNFKFNKALAGGAAEKWVGFATSDINIDIQGYALHSGYVTGGSWDFSAGPIYLSDVTPGAVTQTEPSDSIIAGFAIQTAELLIKPWVEITGSGGAGEVAEGHISIFPKSYSSKSGTWSNGNNTSQTNFHYYYASSGNGAKIDYKVYLGAGVYTIKYMSISTSAGAFVQAQLDGTPVGHTVDMYKSSNVWNDVKTIAGITVATSGIKEFSLLSQGKNSASSNYRVYLSTIALYRTA